MIVHRDRSGNSFTYSYDALNRVTQGVDGTTYSYDNLGRLTGSSYAGRTVSFTYDALGRTTSQTTGNLGTIRYQYDLAGRRTRLTWPDGFWVGYAYDMAGDLTTVTEQGATSGPGLLASYSYNSLNRRTNASLDGGLLSQGYSYDYVSRLAAIGYGFTDTSKNSILNLAYDEAGRIKIKTFTNGLYELPTIANAAVGYAVNGLDQLTGLTVTGQAARSYTSDAKGNLHFDGTNTYTYDDFNRLVSGASASLAYDALGRLYSSANNSTGAITQYLYDGSELIGEYDGSGRLTARYVHGSGVDNPIVSYGGTNAATRTWLMADEHGSIVAQATQAGGLLNANTYDEYGVPGPGNAGRFQYAGQAWIPEAGLYYDKARFYSPTLGRFLQTDPIGYGDGMNWYNYTHSDPVDYVDPTGTDPSGIIAGGVIGLTSGAITFAASGSHDLGVLGVDLATGLAGGVATGALSPNYGVQIAAGFGIGAFTDAVGQFSANGGLKNFNIGELTGAALGGAIAGAIGVPISNITIKSLSSLPAKSLGSRIGSGFGAAAGGELGLATSTTSSLVGGSFTPPAVNPPALPNPGTFIPPEQQASPHGGVSVDGYYDDDGTYHSLNGNPNPPPQPYYDPDTP